MKIDYLAHHLDSIPTVAQWYFEVWRRFSENLLIEHTKLRLAERLNTDKLDICFLCFGDDDELVGTFSLTQKDIPNNEDFSPCLLNLFVAEKYRRQKIGGKLIEYAKQKAKDFGFEKLYLYTQSRRDSVKKC
jgi:predicted N-acetyltransferase YhbS